MDIIKRFEKNQNKIADLKAKLENANKNIDDYKKEKEVIENQLKQIEKKYDVQKSRELIKKLPDEIRNLEDDLYVYFLKQIYSLDKKADRKGVYININKILDKRGVDLYISIGEEILFSELYFDEKDKSLQEYDSDNYESRTIIEFSNSLNLEDLQNILNEINITIDILSIYDLLRKGIRNGMISQDLKKLFKKHQIHLYNKDVYPEDVSLCELADNYILENNGENLLCVSKNVDYDDLFDSLKEDLKILNEKLENDKDYQEYLRLKSIFE